MNHWGKKIAGFFFLVLIGLAINYPHYFGGQPTNNDWLNIIAVLIATGYVFD